MEETLAATAMKGIEREELFARLVATQLERGYRTAALFLGSQTEAEDAIQDALLRAWQRLPDLRSEERIDSWFGRILVNVCRDRLRSRRSIVRWAPSHVATNDPADKVERDQLEAALSDLSPDHRIAVVLRYFGDLSVDDIAIRTRTTHGTVKSRLHYALRLLRAALEAQERKEDGRG